MSAKLVDSRHKAREYAFQVLYALTFSPASTIAELESAFRNRPDQDERERVKSPWATPEDANPPAGAAWALTLGVWKNQNAIDEVINLTSRHWRVDRIGRIELTILRIGVYELKLAENKVPAKVAIDEALKLTRAFAGENAIGFVNGVLDAVARR